MLGGTPAEGARNGQLPVRGGDVHEDGVVAGGAAAGDRWDAAWGDASLTCLDFVYDFSENRELTTVAKIILPILDVEACKPRTRP